MLLPAEAELAQPPVFTDRQEAEFENEALEQPLDATHSSGQVTRSGSGSTLTNNATGGELKAKTGAELEKGQEYIVVDFEAGSGEDPKEWSKGHKWFVTLSCSSLCLIVALGSAMPTGDFAGPAKSLHVGNEVIFLTISLFVVGFGVGPLAFAPLSEVVGRKMVYCISIFLYFIFTLPSALAPNIGVMLAFRLLAGICSSAPMTNAGGSIADVWNTAERGPPMALFSATIFLGPCLGPLFGGWISYKTGQWRWIYWVLFIVVGVVFCFTLVMPETLPTVLLRRKAAKLNKEHNTTVYVSKHDLNRVPLAETIKAAATRPFILMFCELPILFMSFYLSFVYSLLYATFFAFPIAFEEIRGYNAGITGVTFCSIMLGIFIAMACMPLQERFYKRKCAEVHIPEYRLVPMMVGSVILPCSLFILAFTSYPGISWVGPCAAGVLFGLAMVIVYISANTYIVDAYSSYAASAIAAKTLMRSLVGASVPLWITQLFHNIGFWQAGLLLAMVSVGIMPIPFFFFWKGAAVRSRSTRAEKPQHI
ncbi:hypothetical protein P7C73_g6529, partial [Tremellales sp. Uapishka_1]